MRFGSLKGSKSAAALPVTYNKKIPIKNATLYMIILPRESMCSRVRPRTAARLSVSVEVPIDMFQALQTADSYP
jgi:hypothetical protein